MLSKIQQWFSEQSQQKSQTDEHKITLATAVLFYEVMRADNSFEQQEQDKIAQQLQQHFQLPPQELRSLIELAEEKSDNAADFQQFTRVINQLYDAEQKRAILDSLWAVAFADHQLSPEEEHTIRKIADLLYLPHSEFIKSKLSVQPNS